MTRLWGRGRIGAHGMRHGYQQGAAVREDVTGARTGRTVVQRRNQTAMLELLRPINLLESQVTVTAERAVERRRHPAHRGVWPYRRRTTEAVGTNQRGGRFTAGRSSRFGDDLTGPQCPENSGEIR